MAQIPEETPYEARDLIEKLLKLDPQQRLGADMQTNLQGTPNGIKELKAHPFFKCVDFQHIF
jgi:hypothetical protein